MKITAGAPPLRTATARVVPGHPEQIRVGMKVVDDDLRVRPSDDHFGKRLVVKMRQAQADFSDRQRSDDADEQQSRRPGDCDGAPGSRRA
jgi:hypothetical protein